MGDTQDPILDETLWWLRPHLHRECGDRTVFDVFTRLLAKNVNPNSLKTTHLLIGRDQIRSERVTRTAQDLASLYRPHEGAEPQRTDCPIIIAVYEGQERLLDGNNRINYWLRERDTAEHVVHVHTISGSGRFAPLDPV